MEATCTKCFFLRNLLSLGGAIFLQVSWHRAQSFYLSPAHSNRGVVFIFTKKLFPLSANNLSRFKEAVLV